MEIQSIIDKILATFGNNKDWFFKFNIDNIWVIVTPQYCAVELVIPRDCVFIGKDFNHSYRLAYKEAVSRIHKDLLSELR